MNPQRYLNTWYYGKYYFFYYIGEGGIRKDMIVKQEAANSESLVSGAR